MATNNFFESYALKYHQLGWQVIPCSGKVPLVSWELYQDERQNPFSIQLLIDKFKNQSNINIGLVTGELSNVTVLDIDSSKESISADSTPEQILSSLPKTLTQKTGSGGYHLFYKFSKDIPCSTKKLHPRVDTKSQGGFIVLAPSIHPTTKTQYKFLSPLTQVQNLPDFPLKCFNGTSKIFPVSITDLKFKKSKDQSQWREIAKGSPFGRRNSDAASFLGLLLHQLGSKVPPDIIFEFFQTWNKRNSPPLFPNELQHVFDSIGEKYYSQYIPEIEKF